MKINRITLLGAASILSAIALTLFCMQKSQVSVELPEPTGPFKIGRKTLHLIDKSRQEEHYLNHHFRELLLHILYPATISIKDQQSCYADPTTVAIIQEDLSKLTNIPASKLNYLKNLKSHSFENAQIFLNEQTYPIIIFNPGWGTPTYLYSTLLEDLASHGYVVIGVNYPFVTNPVVFPDGRIQKGINQSKDPEVKRAMNIKEISIWTHDITFIIDELEKYNSKIFNNTLNLKRIGIFGHSFGGSVSLNACKSDTRCLAGADIEGKIYETEMLKKPFLFIVSPHAQEILQPVKELSKKSLNSMYYEIDGTNHGSFTDVYFIAKFNKDKLPILSASQGIQITRKLLLNFFNKYLH